jgi:hypothetical protein
MRDGWDNITDKIQAVVIISLLNSFNFSGERLDTTIVLLQSTVENAYAKRQSKTINVETSRWLPRHWSMQAALQVL